MGYKSCRLGLKRAQETNEENRLECPAPEIRGILLRPKWAAGKAVRAGLAEGGSLSDPFDALPHAARVTCIRRPLFFRVARSTRMTQIWALLRQSASDRLEKQPTDLRQNTSYFGDRTLA